MTNSQKGFVVPILLVVIVLLGGLCTYLYIKNKSKVPEVDKPTATQTVSDIQPVSQSSQVAPTPAKPVSTSVNTKVVVKVPPVIKKTIPQVSITVVDEMGAPYNPKVKVWWYSQADANNGGIEHVIPCADKDCVTWNVTGAPGEKIYVAASYQPSAAPGASCFSSAHTAQPVNLSPNSTVKVILTLKMESFCY
jgi:hypothetical protein